MKRVRILLILLVAVTILFSSLPLQGADIKDCVDQAVRQLRSFQNQDGSYGGNLSRGIETPLVLLALSTSPRRYTDIDGPFVRKAVEWILSRQAPSGAVLHPTGNAEGTFLDATALSLAAAASVNPYKRKDFQGRCLEWLSRKVEGRGPGTVVDPGGHIFHEILAYKYADHQGLEAYRIQKIAFREDDPDRLFKAVGLLLNGQKLPDSIRPEQIMKEMEAALGLENAARAEADQTWYSESLASGTRLWAGTYLLALIDEIDTKTGTRTPEGWADRISGLLVQRIERIIQDCRENKTADLMSLALLTNSLSLCYGKTSEGPPISVGPRDALPPMVESPRTLEVALQTSLDYLEKSQKDGRFGFGEFPDPGITAMVLSGVIRTGSILGKEPPAYVEQGLEYLKSMQKEDGSIYQHGLATYVTSASIMALMDARKPEYGRVIEAARAFLVNVQSDEGEGYSLEEDVSYGGLGYGGDERPDLSNTQMALEALRKAGLQQEHEAFRKAIYFLEKCQNLAEFNPTKVEISPGKKVRAGNDGGGIYAPGDSKADLEEVDEGVFVARSYGSMTYALLKSYILSGLDQEDPRVQAAVKWISKNYTLEENPGFAKTQGTHPGQQGLYYYYLTMARALNSLGLDTIVTPDGARHDWRRELMNKTLSLQRVDGSWNNQLAPRWFEGNPVLATAYALLVLDECRKR